MTSTKLKKELILFVDIINSCFTTEISQKMAVFHTSAIKWTVYMSKHMCATFICKLIHSKDHLNFYTLNLVL